MTSTEGCDGCLGSRSCWVCLGHGTLPTIYGTGRTCHRCSGSGACALCQSALPLVDLPAPRGIDGVVDVRDAKVRAG